LSQWGLVLIIKDIKYQPDTSQGSRPIIVSLASFRASLSAFNRAVFISLRVDISPVFLHRLLTFPLRLLLFVETRL
jgi:hypothetical protein